MPDQPQLESFASQLSHLVHRRLVALLFVSYAMAAVVPGPGLWLKHLSFGHVGWIDGSDFSFTMPMLMLAVLLFNAGLGIRLKELSQIWRRPIILVAALLANIAVPLLLVLALRGLMGYWHNSDELQNLLVGLAIIIAMPVAGSSTAWSQNANGNLGLSLGMVLISTILSPITTPLVLHVFGDITLGSYASELHQLASQGANAFLWVAVVIPSLLGILVQFALRKKNPSVLKPYLKLINFGDLLLLNYANAAVALPQAVAQPDWDFLGFVCVTTLGLCLAAYASGWALARVFDTGEADRAALMFGLGMNNNGTGLVLASAAMANHPSVMLPMIFYTLVQQFLAGMVDWKFFRTAD